MIIIISIIVMYTKVSNKHAVVFDIQPSFGSPCLFFSVAVTVMCRPILDLVNIGRIVNSDA